MSKKLYHYFCKETKEYRMSDYRNFCPLGWVAQEATEIPVYKEPELEDGWYLVCVGEEIDGHKYLRQKVRGQGYDINGDPVRTWASYTALKKVTIGDLDE